MSQTLSLSSPSSLPSPSSSASLPIPSEVDADPEHCSARHNSGLYSANACIIIVSTALLCARIYARSLTRAKRGWDEFLLPVAWLLLLGLCAITLKSVQFANVGQHINCNGNDNIEGMLKLIYILDWVYVPSNCLSRVSVVLLFLRVFVSKPSRIACYVTIALLIGNCVATLIVAQLECVPLARTWLDEGLNLDGGHGCFNIHLWWKFTNIPNVILDGIILLLPLRTVWTLNASMTRRTGISFVFLAGSIGVAASSVRTSLFFKTGEFDDPTWAGSTLLAWTVVECGFYFIAACLVGLRPLLTLSISQLKKISGRRPSRWGEYYQNTVSGQKTVIGMDNIDSSNPMTLKDSMRTDSPTPDSHEQNSRLGRAIQVETSIAVESEEQEHHDKQVRSFV